MMIKTMFLVGDDIPPEAILFGIYNMLEYDSAMEIQSLLLQNQACGEHIGHYWYAIIIHGLIIRRTKKDAHIYSWTNYL